jgi:hypothetical protein
MGESLLSQQLGLRLADAIFFAVAKRTILYELALRCGIWHGGELVSLRLN